MFHGSVPSDMRSIVLETVQGWNVEDVYVGCSGNFTIERTLLPLLGPGRMHSNDVQLYSSAIGWWAAGDKVSITLSEAGREELDWLEPYLQTDDDVLATVLLASRFFASVGKEANLYHSRIMRGTKAQYKDMHVKTVEKITRSKLKLASYSCMDVRVWLDEVVKKDKPMICFPPFYSGDYEAQFAALDKYLDWPKPTYDMLDEQGKEDMIDALTDRPSWLVGLHHRRERLEPYLHGVVQTTNRGVPIYVYSSEAVTRVVRPAQQIEPVMVPRLGPQEDIGDQISLHVLTSGQFATLRSQYMNSHIKPGSPLMALVVVVDGKIIGAFAYGSPNGPYDPSWAYLLSDFPIAPTKYKRLSQLIVKAGTSKEAQQLLQRSLSRRLTGVMTTAFTNNPTSMKYRSVFKLIKRSEGTDGMHKFMLNYGGPLGESRLQDLFDEWKIKDGGKVT